MKESNYCKSIIANQSLRIGPCELVITNQSLRIGPCESVLDVFTSKDQLQASIFQTESKAQALACSKGMTLADRLNLL